MSQALGAVFVRCHQRPYKHFQEPSRAGNGACGFPATWLKVGGFKITDCDLNGRGGRRTAPCAFTEQGVAMRRLSDLDEKTESLALQHDAFSRNVRARLKQAFDALRELMKPPSRPSGLSGLRRHRKRRTTRSARPARRTAARKKA